MKLRNKKKKQKVEQGLHKNRVHAAVLKQEIEILFEFGCVINKIIAETLEIWNLQVIECLNEQRRDKGFS